MERGIVRLMDGGNIKGTAIGATTTYIEGSFDCKVYIMLFDGTILQYSTSSPSDYPARSE
jgi:hypothetical protein